MTMVDRACMMLGLFGLGVMTAFGEYDVDWRTFESGGGMSTGGTYAVEGTIGQADARSVPTEMIGAGFRGVGGFWVVPSCPAFPGDFDGDCDVDQADFLLFTGCATGPSLQYDPLVPPPGCNLNPGSQTYIAPDFNTDGDVDQNDFAVFQRCLTGENVPGDPACAE